MRYGYTNLPRIVDSPFIGPAIPLPCLSNKPVFPIASTSTSPVPVIGLFLLLLLLLLMVLSAVVPIVRTGPDLRTGSSKGRLIIDRSDSERLNKDEVYERN